METSIFTQKERTETKYTVQDATNAARAVLTSKGVIGMCVNAVSHRNPNEKITLVELNLIQENIVHDSFGSFSILYEG